MKHGSRTLAAVDHRGGSKTSPEPTRQSPAERVLASAVVHALRGGGDTAWKPPPAPGDAAWVPPPARDYGSSEEIEGDEEARAKFAKDKDSESESEDGSAGDPDAGEEELKGGGSNWVASFERAFGAGAADRRNELADEVQDWEHELDEDGPIAQAVREGKTAKGHVPFPAEGKQVTNRDEGAMFDSVHSGDEGEEGMGSDLEGLEDDAGLEDVEGLEDVDLERDPEEGDASEAVVRSSEIEEGVDDEEVRTCSG